MPPGSPCVSGSCSHFQGAITYGEADDEADKVIA